MVSYSKSFNLINCRFYHTIKYWQKVDSSNEREQTQFDLPSVSKLILARIVQVRVRITFLMVYLQSAILSNSPLKVLDIKFQLCSFFDVILTLFIQLSALWFCSSYAIHYFPQALRQRLRGIRNVSPSSNYSQLLPCGHLAITDILIIRMAAKSPAKINCAVPEKIHTHPMGGYWKFLGGGGS